MKRKTPIRAFSILETSSVGRRNRRAAETRLRLFRCALQLVAERGLPRVTVEDITEAADVGKGTFFNYFESKNHLLATIGTVYASTTVSYVIDFALFARNSNYRRYSKFSTCFSKFKSWEFQPPHLCMSVETGTINVFPLI